MDIYVQGKNSILYRCQHCLTQAFTFFCSRMSRKWDHTYNFFVCLLLPSTVHLRFIRIASINSFLLLSTSLYKGTMLCLFTSQWAFEFFVVSDYSKLISYKPSSSVFRVRTYIFIFLQSQGSIQYYIELLVSS